jgi:hypothetical protein
MQAKADIVALIKTGKVELDGFALPRDKLAAYAELVIAAKRDLHPTLRTCRVVPQDRSRNRWQRLMIARPSLHPPQPRRLPSRMAAARDLTWNSAFVLS